MKKVAILSLTDLRHVTMIKIYTDYFDKEGIQYDIICTARYADSETKYRDATVYSYRASEISASNATKMLKYIEFRKYAISVMKKNRYAYTVVWGEHTAAIFSSFLKKYGPYCVNIRDVGFWKLPFYWKSLCNAVTHSDFSTWCAPRGIELLPPHKYEIVLNQNKELVEGAEVRSSFVERDEKIHVGTVGYIRHIEPSKQIMKALCNDQRYVVQFFGTGSEKLKSYADEIGMKNIEIEGTFTPDKTANLLNRIDVINSFCGDGAKDVTIALGSPIRYGYSTCLYKPAIVSPNTYLSERTKELNIGFTVDNIETMADQFYQWYHSLGFEQFKASCEKYNRDFVRSEKNLNDVCDYKIRPLVMEN